jgi:antitoxin HigA-1
MKHKPIHPGEILKDEFLDPMGISQYRLAKETGIPADRVGKIVHGERAISADTALRFSRFFGNTAAFWMNLQAQYDLEVAEQAAARALRSIKRWRAA